MKTFSRPKTLLVCLATVTWLGCNSQPTGPQLDPTAFPRAVQRLHSLAGDVIEAFDKGAPEDADRPLHSVGKTVSSIKRLAPVAGLSSDQEEALSAAIEEVLDAFQKIHEPMHLEEFPEDFDHAPIETELRAGLKNLVAALPEEIAAKIKPLAPAAAAEEATEAPEEEPTDEPVTEE